MGEIGVFMEDKTITMGYATSGKHYRKGYAYVKLSAVMGLLHETYPSRSLYALCSRRMWPVWNC